MKRIHPSHRTTRHLILQDVGGKSFFIDSETDVAYQIYLLFNGLDVDTDPVLGDYEVSIVSGDKNAPYSITALLGGEVLWVEEGNLTSDRESPTFIVNVSDYADSDCKIGAYGKRGLRIGK